MKPKTNRASSQYVPTAMDRCQTPAYALGPLLPYLAPNWVIWEPACGEGYLVAALHENGFPVIGSDILTGHNFFQFQPSQRWDCMVTNPPYSLKYRWLGRCYELGKPFALLLPIDTIGAKAAQVLFRTQGVEVIYLDQRVNFKMPNKGWKDSSAQFATAWFTHGLNIGRQITFAEIRQDKSALVQEQLV